MAFDILEQDVWGNSTFLQEKLKGLEASLKWNLSNLQSDVLKNITLSKFLRDLKLNDEESKDNLADRLFFSATNLDQAFVDNRATWNTQQLDQFLYHTVLNNLKQINGEKRPGITLYEPGSEPTKYVATWDTFVARHKRDR